MLNWLRCFWNRRHVPTRQFLGGFRCAVCGLAGADMGQLGYGAGYVAPLRLTFSREHGQLTRSTGWDRAQ